MEGKIKILESYLKSDEIISFWFTFCAFAHCYSDFVQQKCHVLVAILCNLILACQLILLKEKFNNTTPFIPFNNGNKQ